MGKVLVSYFSASGRTRRVAEELATITNGDLFEIEPVEKYSNDDLNWSDPTSRSSIEMKDPTSRPAIKNKVTNIDEYDQVIIGFPVWWYTAPHIINSFIEENDLNNKKIYVFATSGGSSVDDSFNNLKKDYNDLDFISSKTLNGDIDSLEITNWIK